MTIESGRLVQLVREFSRHGVGITAIREAAGELVRTASAKDRRRVAARLVDLAADERQRGRMMRARSAILLAVSVDDTALAHIDRTQVLTSSWRGGRATALLDLLAHELPPTRADAASRRVATYVVLDDLFGVVERLTSRYRRVLRRADGLLKAAMTLADLLFFPEFAEHCEDELSERLPVLRTRPEGAEETAEIISSLIADCLQERTATLVDMLANPTESLANEDLQVALDGAALRHLYRDWSKYITALGYDLELRDGLRPCYVLVPPSQHYEQAVRQSYVFAHLSRASRLVPVPADRTALAMRDAAVTLARMTPGDGLTYERSPYPRYVVRALTGDAPGFRRLLDATFVDDVGERMDDDHDLVLPPEAIDALELTTELTVGQFRKLYRCLRFTAYVHGESLLRQRPIEVDTVLNSLVAVLDESRMAELLAPTGESPAVIAAFLDAISFAGDRRPDAHLDLQYTPAMRVAGFFMLPLRLIAASGTTRNALAHARRRDPEAGERLERIVAELLRIRFPQVATNRPLAVGDERAECDVVAVVGSTLVCFECKHALRPVSPHEHREAWQSIVRGVEQMLRIERLLAQPGMLERKVREWFPALDRLPDRVRMAVVTSTSTGSGMEVSGVPIRDLVTLRNVLRTGTIEIGVPTERGADVDLLGFWRDKEFSPEDLLDYLSEDGLYWRMRRCFADPTSYLDFQSEELTLARETYVTQLSSDPAELRADLERIGLQHLGRAVHEGRHPASVTDMQELYAAARRAPDDEE